MLKIHKVVKRFGEFKALDNCSFELEKGEIVGLIGPNGAGKSTLINVITGFLECDSGEIFYKGKPIHKSDPNIISRMGLVRTHQIPRFFLFNTVLDCLIIAGLAAPNIEKSGVSGKVEKMLEMFKLEGIKNEITSNISVGQQKLLEFAMKMMLDPETLMLDEPYQGVHPSMIEISNQIILNLNKQFAKTVLVISHNFPVISSICSRVIVLNSGKIIATGTAEEVKNNKKVIETYLGGV